MPPNWVAIEAKLSKKLLELGVFVPEFSKINLEPFKYGMIFLNDRGLLSANQDFNYYLESINENEDWKKLQVLSKIDKKSLSMPLFYRLILSAYSEYHDNCIKDPYTDLLFEELLGIFMNKEIKKSNANKSQYAMLEDRVNVNKNKKQRFGSLI